MKIVLTDKKSNSILPSGPDNHHEDSLTNNLFTLPIFGKTILNRNLEILDSLYDVESIIINRELKNKYKIFGTSFNIPFEMVEDETYIDIVNNKHNFNGISHSFVTNNEDTVQLLNTSQLTLSNEKFMLLSDSQIILHSEDNITISEVEYPWEFLKMVQLILKEEIRTKYISPRAKIAKTAIIDGPCVIEDEVIIDDYAKIKGPSFIGNGSFIGMGSLIRNSMLNNNTSIGYNCEIGKSYFSGHDKISHHNVVLDSLIGKNVWFGGFSGTANVLLNRKNIQFKINDHLVDTGNNHFGAVVSNNSSIGASVIILPGRKVLPNSIIPAGTVYSG